MDIMTEDEPTTLDMDRIAALVVESGHSAYVEQTGGGVATIFAGTCNEVVAGPGWFEGPGFTIARCFPAEFYVSRDGAIDDDDDYATCETLTDEQSVADVIVNCLTK